MLNPYQAGRRRSNQTPRRLLRQADAARASILVPAIAAIELSPLRESAAAYRWRPRGRGVDHRRSDPSLRTRSLQNDLLIVCAARRIGAPIITENVTDPDTIRRYLPHHALTMEGWLAAWAREL
jgi:hypothetical protein